MEQPFDGQALGEQLVGIVREFVARKNDELIRAFEYALVNYAGTHETGRCYPEGVVVAHGGGLWRAGYKTASRPGEGQAWMPYLIREKETA